MKAHYHLIDTFAESPFQGNPTPVCISSSGFDSNTMQKLAQEFSAPVTAFVVPQDHGNYTIRYFTIEEEIPACGHATLGAAQIILDENPTLNQVEFFTAKGLRIVAAKNEELVYLDYPILTWKPVDVPQKVIKALGIPEVKTAFYSKALETLFIELGDESQIKQITPDFEKLRNSSHSLKEVVILSESKSDRDFVLRSFCPWIGVDEDPVTGSIHSVLGPYWKEKTGRDELKAFQASDRGGIIYVKVHLSSVKIGGYSKRLVSGQLLV